MAADGTNRNISANMTKPIVSKSSLEDKRRDMNPSIIAQDI